MIQSRIANLLRGLVENWFTWLAFAFLWLAALGIAGDGLGVHHLFRQGPLPDTVNRWQWVNHPVFWSTVMLALFATYLNLINYFAHSEIVSRKLLEAMGKTPMVDHDQNIATLFTSDTLKLIRVFSLYIFYRGVLIFLVSALVFWVAMVAGWTPETFLPIEWKEVPFILAGAVVGFVIGLIMLGLSVSFMRLLHLDLHLHGPTKGGAPRWWVKRWISDRPVTIAGVLPFWFLMIGLLFAGSYFPLIASVLGIAVACWIIRALGFRLWWVSYAGWAFVLSISAALALSDVLLPVVAVTALIILISCAFNMITRLYLPMRAGIVGALALLAYVSGNFGVEYRFPGLDDFYVQRVKAPSTWLDEPAGQDGNGESVGAGQTVDLIEPVEALTAWKKAICGDDPSCRPTLTVIATSGGAYRATFWTSEVMDRLFREEKAGALPGFAKSIRFITGASGGMVAGAYLAAADDLWEGKTPDPSLTKRIECDVLAMRLADLGDLPDYCRDLKTTEALRARLAAVPRKDCIVPGYDPESGGEGGRPEFFVRTHHPIVRDSLSPVVQRLVQRDFWDVFAKFGRRRDRGVVLEQQWPRLLRAVVDLKTLERDGMRPSIIFSPTIVETGQPLLISNLDLREIRGEYPGKAVEFFHTFPKATECFSLATAARMGATFPFVSPAVSLPTKPRRRVVDAGYYDNYGVSSAVALLKSKSVQYWLQRNVRQVVVIQIRAFELSCEPKAPGQLSKAAAAFLAPLDGVLAARSSSMIFRNEVALDLLKDALSKVRPPGAWTGLPRELFEAGENGGPRSVAVRTVILENHGNIGLNWYLSAKESRYMSAVLSGGYDLKNLPKDLGDRETRNIRAVEAQIAYLKGLFGNVAEAGDPPDRLSSAACKPANGGAGE